MVNSSSNRNFCITLEKMASVLGFKLYDKCTDQYRYITWIAMPIWNNDGMDISDLQNVA